MLLGELLELVRWYMGVLNKGTLATNLIHNLTINISCGMLYLLKYLEDILMGAHENNKRKIECEFSTKQSNFTKQGSNAGNNTMNKIANIKQQQSNNNNKE